MQLHPALSHDMFVAVNTTTQVQSNIGPQSNLQNKQLSRNPVFLLSRIVCLLDFCRLLSCYLLYQSIWRFYGDVIYMGLWHVNDAREPCLPSIFMNNCVWGAVEMEGGGTATRPPKVSRAQSVAGGAAEASSSHACRHWPTCSSRLVAFPERRSMIMNEQRNDTLRSGYSM